MNFFINAQLTNSVTWNVELQHAVTLLGKMLEYNPTNRITTQEALLSPFFANTLQRGSS